MTWGAVAGGAISAAGSLLSKPKAPKAPKPYDTYSSLGSADYDPKNKSLDLSLSPEMQGWQTMFGGLGQGYLGGWGSPTAPFQSFATGQVQGQMPFLFDQSQAASMLDPRLTNMATNQMFGAAGKQMGLGDAASQFGLQQLLGGPVGGGMAQGMYGLGLGMLGERPQSYDAQRDQMLAQLRAEAAPFEQQAGLGLQQNLFNTGRLGTSGGGMNIEAFARGLGQADLSRSVQANQFAQDLYGRDLQAALARNSMGAGLMQGGLGGYQTGSGLQAQQAQGFLGLGGELYGSGAGLYGSGAGLNMGLQNLQNERGLQRLNTAQQLFGFGTQLGQQDIATGTGLFGQVLGINNALLDQAKVGGAMAGATMGGPQPASNTSALLGGALGGLGGAVAGMDLRARFGGGGDPTGGVLDADTLKLIGLG
jgi:hypothetical protein